MSKNRITRTTGGSSHAPRSEFDFLKFVTNALLVVLFLGFAGMFVAVSQILIDSLNDRRDSTYELQQKIDDQNDAIERLTEEIRKKKETTDTQQPPSPRQE